MGQERPATCRSFLVVDQTGREPSMNRRLTEFSCNLIGDLVEFPVTFSFRFIEKLLLGSA